LEKKQRQSEEDAADFQERVSAGQRQRFKDAEHVNAAKAKRNEEERLAGEGAFLEGELIRLRAEEASLQRSIETESELQDIKRQLDQLQGQIVGQKLSDASPSLTGQIAHLKCLVDVWPARKAMLTEQHERLVSSVEGTERQLKSTKTFFQRAKEALVGK
jgi:hypothetical protein